MIEILNPTELPASDGTTGALVADILQTLRSPQRGRHQPPRHRPVGRRR